MLSSCDSTLLFFPKHLRFLLREINRYVHTYRLTYILTGVINLTAMNSEDLIAFWAGRKLAGTMLRSSCAFNYLILRTVVLSSIVL